jgi:HD-like signal output (HDOD) protein
VIGFHHGDVGGALIRAWGLPDNVAEAVAFHHEPTETSNRLATLVSLADAAAHVVGAVGSGGACVQPDWAPEGAEALGATRTQLDRFLEELRLVEESEI